MTTPSRRRSRLATAGVAALLVGLQALFVVPSAAAADDPWGAVSWTAPTAISPVGVDVELGGVWQLTDGSQLALWSVYDYPLDPNDGPAQVWTSVRPTPTGTWSEPAQITDYQQYFSAYPNFAWAVDPSGAAVVAWHQYDPGNSEWTMRAATRGTDGTWTAPSTVVRPNDGTVGSLTSADAKAVAVATDGRASLAFTAREAAAGPGEIGADLEVFRAVWSGSAWSMPEEISVETPLHPINCVEPNPDDCPDREGSSRQPLVVYDGLGEEWIAWVHDEASDEPAEETGVFLRGSNSTHTMHLATGSEEESRYFSLGGIAADPAGGVAVAWTRQIAAGIETWAHAGGDLSGATSRITAPAENGVVRTIAIRDGRAVVVVGLAPSGIDGSRKLVTATRPQSGDWAPASVAQTASGDVVATGGQSEVTPGGVPVVTYVTGAGDLARAMAPDGTRWSDASVSGALKVSGAGTLIHSFQVTPAGTLLASWLSGSGGVNRLHVAASDGLPTGSFPDTPTPPGNPGTPQPVPPPSAPAITTPGAAAVTTARTQVVRWTASPGATYDLRWRRARWNGGFTAYVEPPNWQGIAATFVSHAVVPGSTTCYSVRARTDGGASPWSTERCVIAPLDQTSLTRSSGWELLKAAKYFGGSTLLTSRKNATLTRNGARLSRVGVLATTCPACGAVDVFVGNKRIGRIKLNRGKKEAHRKVLLLPAFSARNGRVRVVVVTKGRPVRIDGLVIGAQ